MANKRFKRQEYARYKKLGIKWRRPRGKTSKMRRYEAGKPDMPAIGYRTPRAIRDLHPSGYNDVLVHKTAVNHGDNLQCLPVGYASAIDHPALNAQLLGNACCRASAAVDEYLTSLNLRKTVEKSVEALVLLNNLPTYLYDCYFLFHQ